MSPQPGPGRPHHDSHGEPSALWTLREVLALVLAAGVVAAVLEVVS